MAKRPAMIRQILKVPVLVVVIAATLISFLLSGSLFFESDTQIAPILRYSLCLFLFGIGALLIWHTVRLLNIDAKLPNPPVPNPGSAIEQLHCTFHSTVDLDALRKIEELLAAKDFAAARASIEPLLSKHPDDVLLLSVAMDTLLALNEAAPAEQLCDRILEQLTDRYSDSYNLDLFYSVVAQRLLALLLQNDGRFEAECKTFLANPISAELKVTVLDQLASIPLYRELPHLYGHSEFCILTALDLAPGTLTLQGTLGGLLAERGEFIKAAPLLRECYHRSSARHDRAISGYYLALLAANHGDSASALKLARESLALYSEPWLTTKATALLHRLDRPERVISPENT